MRVVAILSLIAVATGVPIDALSNSTRMTLDEKIEAETESVEADNHVSALEKSRDEAWHNARGTLALASSPPIRSSGVFSLLSAETDRFGQLEASIKQAKDEASHKRRVAELAGNAWDAQESQRLKLLRLEAAEAGLVAARQAEAKAREDEAELLHELALEKAGVVV